MEDGTVSSTFCESPSVYPGGDATAAPAISTGGYAPVAGEDKIGVCAAKREYPPDGFEEAPSVAGTSTWSCGLPVPAAFRACLVLALADSSGKGDSDDNKAPNNGGALPAGRGGLPLSSLEGGTASSACCDCHAVYPGGIAAAAAADPTVEGSDGVSLAGDDEIGVCEENRECPPVGFENAPLAGGTSTWSCV